MRNATEALPDVTTTAPEDWRYISEGGASIVFSYCGPSHPKFTGTVLRLRKHPQQATLTPSVLESAKGCEEPHTHDLDHSLIPEIAPVDAIHREDDHEQEEDEADDATIAFQEKVILKLVPAEHLPRLEAVRVGKDWLEKLRRSSEKHRPPERIAVDEIDTSHRKAVLATDLVGGDGWAVEIKPKWGFLPNPQFIAPGNKDLKTRYCRFCMHAHYKSLQGETVSHGYCPLDLYSGDEARVAKSIRCLWRAWVHSGGTVNNLKVFVQGGKIDPSNIHSIGILSKQLNTPFDPSADECREDLLEPFITALLPLLLNTPLLATLSRLQRSLDSLDIEGLSRLWKLYSEGTPVGHAFPDPSMADWEHFAQAFTSSEYPYLPDEGLPDVAHLRYHSMAYLLSATFKDCSVILRFGRRDGLGDTITAIDLDPKSMKRLSKWEKLDRAILEAFTGAEADPCVDARSL